MKAPPIRAWRVYWDGIKNGNDVTPGGKKKVGRHPITHEPLQYAGYIDVEGGDALRAVQVARRRCVVPKTAVFTHVEEVHHADQ